MTVALRPEAAVPTGEHELVARALVRDEAAIRALVARHNRRLYRIARSILKSDAEAEDVVTDFDFSRAEHDWRLKPGEFKSEAFRRDAFERERAVEEENVNLQRLAEALDRRPIDEIAALMRGLTYGDMIELAESIWSARPENLDFSKDTLPNLLHRWSSSRKT